MGPGPAGPPWPPPRVRPGAGWYALPIAFTAVAVAGLLVMIGVFWDDSEVAYGSRSAGDPGTGVSVELSKGHGYFLYVGDGSTVPYTCFVRVGGTSGPVQLTRKNAWSASGVTGYHYTASFEAPVSGTARLTCRGVDGRLLVTPDDTVHFYLGLSVLVSGAFALFAIISFVFLLVRRGGAKRAAVPVPGPYRH
ncbi:hypothetical protein [Actinomadura roseirufa]|uniref:hypothetical protein n=1 Tax=Actinomadura roseirufa TaxID=2094049 RepID=UPI001040F965|nr:hypothetical protein [Actinomadura roseirufa]